MPLPLGKVAQFFFINKKVLLRERKRHTAFRVASARFADGGGRVPPIQSWTGGTPGYSPTLILDGVPHQQDGVSPYPDFGWGYLPPNQQDGVPLQLDLVWGKVPIWTWDGVPPRKCGQTETITFPHPSDAGGKNTREMRSLGT